MKASGPDLSQEGSHIAALSSAVADGRRTLRQFQRLPLGGIEDQGERPSLTLGHANSASHTSVGLDVGDPA